MMNTKIQKEDVIPAPKEFVGHIHFNGDLGLTNLCFNKDQNSSGLNKIK